MRRLKTVCLAIGGVLGGVTSTWGQQRPTYSVDFQGPVKGVAEASGSGRIISEGDILEAPAPAGLPFPGVPPPPVVVVAATANPFILPNLGLFGPAFPGPAGFPTGLEVDALSYGTDYCIGMGMAWPTNLTFSVDEFAAGIAGSPAPPNVFTEGVLGAAEASADIYMYFPPVPFGVGVLPAPPFVVPPGNTLVFDGNGLPSPAGILPPFPFVPAPGSLSLVEPNPPTPGGLPDPGSNLDAWDIDTIGPGISFPVYFSLDSGFPDVLEPPAVCNSGSAAALGYSGGDILASLGSGGPVVLYAPAAALGLDLMGVDTDDLDALILAENGVLGYQPQPTLFPPYACGAGGFDMVWFSVRRGSAVLLALDSCLGLPIQPGDILVPPPAPGLPPCIIIAAENLGLATTRPGGMAGPFGADDLDALDLAMDCNGNMIADGLDISYGLGLDGNGNGILDACELLPPLPAPAPSDMSKERYLSFDPNNTGTVAFLVTKTTLPAGTCWVGTPNAVGEAQCVPAPVFRVWTEAVVHVGDCEIIPDASYDLSATPDGIAFSATLTVVTTPYPTLNTRFCGDLVGIFTGTSWTPPNGFTNVTDIVGILARVSGATGAPTVQRVNIAAIASVDSCLNGLINTADVLAEVRCFSGAPYAPPKITDPTLCPACPYP